MTTVLSRKRRSPNDKLSELNWEHSDSYTLTPTDIANGWFEHQLIHPRIVYKLLVRCRVNAAEYPFSSMIVDETTGIVHVTLGGWETVNDDVKFQYYYRHGGRLVPAPDPPTETILPLTSAVMPQITSAPVLAPTITGSADTALRDDDDATYYTFVHQTGPIKESGRRQLGPGSDYSEIPDRFVVKLRYEFTVVGTSVPVPSLQWVVDGNSGLYIYPQYDAGWSTAAGIHELEWTIDAATFNALTNATAQLMFRHIGYPTSSYDEFWTHWTNPTDFPGSNWLQLAWQGTGNYTVKVYECSVTAIKESS